MPSHDLIAGPTEVQLPGLMVPCVIGDGSTVMVPFAVCASLPSGGFLQVVVGANPLAIPTPSCPLPRGCMLAIIPPEAAEHMRKDFEREHARHKHLNPFIVLPANGLPGSDLITPP